MIYLVHQVSCYSIATMETFDVAKCCAEISPLFPWDQLDIHPKQLGSMPNGNIRVPIYQHADNKTISYSTKRFFYLPVPLFNYKSAVYEYNYVTGQKELRFSVQMWNDEVEKQIANYVGELMGKHIVQKQIEMVPFDKVMLATSTKAWQCKYTNWLPYRMQKDFWFSVVAERKPIIDLAKEMHSKPRQFINDFSVLFSTESETFVNGQKARHIELGLDAIGV